MDDLLSVFIAETTQSLDEGEVSFKAIQKAPGDHGAIDNLLRLMNSIRETSGFLGLPALNAMAVMAVDQLTQLRSSKGTDAWERIPAVKESLRVLRTLLRDLAERSGAPEAAKPESKAREKEPKPAKEASAKEPAAKEAKEPKSAKEPRESKATRAAKAAIAAAEVEEGEEDVLPPAKPVKTKAPKVKQALEPAPAAAEAATAAATPAPTLPAPEPAPPVAEAAHPSAERPIAPPADMAAMPAGAVVVQAQTLENLLSTVNNLMAAQTEMIQLMRNLGVTMPRGGNGPAQKSSARPPSEPRVLANRPRADNGAQPAPDATTRTLASASEETSTPNGNVVRLRDRRSDSGPEAAEPTPLPPVKTQMMALEEAAETQLDEGAHLQLFSGAHGRIRTVDTAKVARIVEVDLAAIDSSRALWMAEIDDLLVPLVLCDRDLALPEKGSVPIIVLSFDGQWLGLMAAEIGTVARAPVDTSYADLHAGRAGLATVNGQDLEVIEPAFYLAEALRQRTRVPARRVAAKQKRSTAASTAILADAEDLFVRKPGH